MDQNCDQSCIIIVDVQKGFINRWTGHIPALVEALQNDYGRVIVTRFINPEGSMHRKLIGWRRFAPDSEDTELAFKPRPGATIIDKHTYTCVTPKLVDDLHQNCREPVHLCGIATDNCILKTAVDLFEAGITPVVLASASASHGGPDCHEAGLMLLRRFIGEAQVAE